MTKFTALETRALRAAIASSDGNGHDFGYTSDIVEALPDLTPQQVGGLISSLQAKGVFDWIDGGVRLEFRQFTLADAYAIAPDALLPGDA